MKTTLEVNGLSYEVSYRDKDVQEIFAPLLKRWSEAAKTQSERYVVLLAAPPGTGKTTLALFLEKLSRETPGCTPLQAVGMDGFHFPNAYLDSHYFVEDGEKLPLRARKGAYFTFDVEGLSAALADLRSNNPQPWPTYSRTLHDVVPGAIDIHERIVLVEGNYLLLNRERWRDLTTQANDTLIIRASAAALHDRLVGRKIAGGTPREEAEAWYLQTDAKNIAEVLENSQPANTELTLDPNGNFHLAHST